MASQTIVVLLLALSVVYEVHGEVWEFGQDTPDSFEVFHDSGSISPQERLKNIDITVDCVSTDYVRLEIESAVGPFSPLPSVTYNKELNEVTILYPDAVHIEAKYNILVKGKAMPTCNEHTKPAAARRYYGTYGSYGGYPGYSSYGSYPGYSSYGGYPGYSSYGGYPGYSSYGGYSGYNGYSNYYGK